MAKKNSNWLKLHRSILSSPQFTSPNPNDLKVWLWLMCRAAPKKKTVTVKIGKGIQIVKLDRGQLLFGRFSAERDLNIDGSAIYRIMQRFVSDGCILIEPNNQYSIVTLTNFIEHQDYEQIEDFEILDEPTGNEQPMNKQPTTNAQATDKQPTQSNTVKNIDTVQTVKNSTAPVNGLGDKVEKKKKEKQPPRQHWQKLVDAWFDFYKQKNGGEEPNFTRRQPALFGQLIDLLAARAKKKNKAWDESYAVGALNFFLSLAYSDDWLSKHFLLTNLVDQFDAIFAREANRKKPAVQNSGPGPVNFDDEVKFLIGRMREGELDQRLITPELYDKLVTRSHIKLGTLNKFTAPTPDEQKRLAALDWITTQSKA